MTDPDLGKAWLETLEHQRRLSRHTLANYSRAVEVLFKLKDKIDLHDLDAQQIRRFAARLHAAGYSGRTLALILESYNLRNRANVLAVNDLMFPLQIGQPEGRLTQVGVRLMF